MDDNQPLPSDAGSEAPLPILGIRKTDLPARVLVVGDPVRAEAAALLLDDHTEVGRNREYVTFVGTYRGTAVAVVSHGVGAPGAAVCFEELCQAGAQQIIRAGTAGGMQTYLGDGDLVVVTGAVREDGVTERIVPLGYPAVPNLDLVRYLGTAAAAREHDVHEGIVLTSGLFYPHPVLGSNLPLWQRAGVVAVEMECAALFVIEAQHGAAAAAILALDGNPLAEGDDDMTGYDPHRSVVRAAVDAALEIALDALVLR